LLNGFVNFDYWLPTEKMSFPRVSDFLTKYQARAQQEGVDALGYHIAPWGYSQLQVLQQAVTAMKSFDDNKLADYIHKSTFKTLVGDVEFGPKGEWAQSRVLELQFQHIRGNDLGQFKDLSTQIVILPAQYKSWDLIYPYEKAK
jgi:branched-chain amino acid transport system substrate-binding protein